MIKNKILVVLRHGEADLVVGNDVDFNRALTKNGKNQLLKLKELFVKTGIQVGKIISSPSKRTAQTAEIISSSMNKPIIEFNDRLYEAEVSMILGIIAQTTHLHDCVMLIGHNPAVSALISHVADQRHLNIQPGMMVIIELTVTDWNHVGISTGIVREVLL